MTARRSAPAPNGSCSSLFLYSRAVSGTSAHVRLLLIEDVAQVSQYIRNLLHAQDQVQLLDVLTDGRQALEQVAQVRPDVVMIDSLLQGKLGTATLEQPAATTRTSNAVAARRDVSPLGIMRSPRM